MKINNLVDKDAKRIKVAEGSVGEESFAVSILIDGSSIVIEFEDRAYSVDVAEIVKIMIETGEIEIK